MHFFVAVVEHLQSHLPFENTLLKHLSCLNPKKRKEYASDTAIKDIARKLHVAPELIARVCDEWKVYQLDIEVDSLIRSQNEVRVDHFWRDVFKLKSSDDSLKYTTLSIVVKRALTLPHGNADVERGISVNNGVVTTGKTKLNEKTINGVRIIKDIIKFSDPDLLRPEKIPLSKEVLTAARRAHAAYQLDLQQKREKKEMKLKEKQRLKEEAEKILKDREQLSQQHKTLNKKEEELLLREEKLREEGSSAGVLLKDGNKKLQDAITRKDLTGVSAAQMMIETASQKQSAILTTMGLVREELKCIESKKRKLFEKSVSDAVGDPSHKKMRKRK